MSALLVRAGHQVAEQQGGGQTVVRRSYGCLVHFGTQQGFEAAA
jgi:hypothetical protein